MTLVVRINQPEYPPLLKIIHNPPQKLFCKGDITILSSDLCIAIVGTRNATQYGEFAIDQFLNDFSMCNIVIVSGLARGIDTYAHKAAIKYGLKTIAVLGTGIDNIYPEENRPLADEIISKGGAVISEYPGESPANNFQFPMRNRIIAGLSVATIVIEAPAKSGALITAKRANEESREVFAVPGDIDKNESKGCNLLIQNLEAKVATSGMDIIRELSLNRQMSIDTTIDTTKNQAIHSKPQSISASALVNTLNLPKESEKILELIPKTRPISFDKLLEKLTNSDKKKPTSEAISNLNKNLSLLEINNLVSSISCGFYIKTC